MHGDIFGFLFAAAFETGKYSEIFTVILKACGKNLLSAYIHISPLK